MQLQQLTPQTVAESFSPNMLNDDACRKWVIEMTRGEVPVCPFCGVHLNGRNIDRLLDGKRVQCHACDRHSSPRTGTILEGSTLSDRQLFFMLTLLHWEIPVYTIAAMTGCDHSTVYNWRSRLMADD